MGRTIPAKRAAAGEDIIVTNHGKPVAVVSGCDLPALALRLRIM
ncbi:MAG: type II toxin-antitoxin system prevent-host-death family antitoxin [Candidatus Atribacteria bacterium]|nr:type II toxin-antitoxin system prevent-host-death family antitoxin [Candidatus Atribacteria bacterium]